MLKLIVLVSVLAVAAAYPSQLTSRSNPDGRIVGGESTPIDKVPYQVSLESYGQLLCGGSIISEEWILTAAHCVDDAVTEYSIRVGTNRQAAGGSVHSVIEVKVHKGYDLVVDGIPINDIALVRVKEPFVFDNNTQPIELYKAREEAVVGSMGVVTGWGSTNIENDMKILQIIQVPITPKSSCFSKLNVTAKGQICAGYPEGGKDACEGDSGGPLAIDGRLAGIVSWGMECAQPGYPGVYTEVAFYRNWIKRNSGV